MGCRRAETAIRTDVDFKPAIHRETAPVAVVRGQQRWLFVIALRLDRIGDDRVPAVGADNDLRMFSHPGTSRRAASNAYNTSLLKHDLFDRKRFANFCTRRGRRVHEQLVENRPPRTVRRWKLVLPWGSRNDHR